MMLSSVILFLFPLDIPPFYLLLSHLSSLLHTLLHIASVSHTINTSYVSYTSHLQLRTLFFTLLSLLISTTYIPHNMRCCRRNIDYVTSLGSTDRCIHCLWDGVLIDALCTPAMMYACLSWFLSSPPSSVLTLSLSLLLMLTLSLPPYQSTNGGSFTVGW